MVIRACLLAVCALVLTATPAAAHAELIASNPPAGAQVAAAPAQVELTFNEPVIPQAVSVAGPGGVAWTVNAPSVAGATVVAPVVPAGPAGEYTLTYEVLSSDGDPVRGTVVFTMTTAVGTTAVGSTAATPSPSTTTGAPSAAPTSERPSDALPPAEDDGLPAWVWFVIGAAVLAAAVTVALVRARRR